MKRLRSPGWFLALTTLVLVSGVAALLLGLREKPAVSVQVEGVKANRMEDGSIRLQLSGKELHGGFSAVLIPDLRMDGLAEDEATVPVALYQLATDGRLAVASTRDHRLLIMDVASGRRPVVKGSVKLIPEPLATGSTPVNAVELIDSLAVVTRSEFGLTLVDVTDPAAPRQVDYLEYRGNFSEMERSGNLLYVLNSRAGILVVARDGDRLRQRFAVESPNAWRLAVHGRRMVVAAHQGELTFFDLDAEGRPLPVGTLKLGQDVRDLALSADALYVCTAKGQLLEYSLRGWPAAVLSAQLDLQGRPLRIEWAEDSRRLYCSLVSQGIVVVDVARPGVPRIFGLLPMSKAPLSQKVRGGRLFLAGSGGLQIVTAEVPTVEVARPRPRHPFAEVTGKVRLFPWGSSVFAYDQERLAEMSRRLRPAVDAKAGTPKAAPLLALPGENDLRLYAVRDGVPQDEIVGRVPAADPDVTDRAHEVELVRSAFWQSGRLYLLTPFRLKIFACVPSGSVTPVGEHRLPGDAVTMLWLKPALVAVVMRQKGLQVIDVGDPAAPAVVSEYPIPRHLRTIGPFGDALFDGRRLFVARGRLGVAVFDLSEPTAPRLVQQIDTPGHANGLTLEDGLLTVGDQGEGAFVIDVRREHGVPVGSYPLPGIPKDILAYGRRLFVVNAAGGVLDLPAPWPLAKGQPDAAGQLLFTAPADVPVGRYSLLLYAGEEVSSFPVVLQ